MAASKDGQSTIAYFGDGNSCNKHAMFAIDFAAALVGPDRSKWSATPQSSTVKDMTLPPRWRT
jgi:hypothetical protein